MQAITYPPNKSWSSEYYNNILLSLVELGPRGRVRSPDSHTQISKPLPTPMQLSPMHWWDPNSRRRNSEPSANLTDLGTTKEPSEIGETGVALRKSNLRSEGMGPKIMQTRSSTGRTFQSTPSRMRIIHRRATVANTSAWMPRSSSRNVRIPRLLWMLHTKGFTPPSDLLPRPLTSANLVRWLILLGRRPQNS